LANADVVARASGALRVGLGAVAELQIPPAEIAEAIRRLMNAANVVVKRPAIEAGLGILDAGGDFADGKSLTKEAGLARRSSSPSTKPR
jgi:hypothetical protein